MNVGEIIEELSKYDVNLPTGISVDGMHCVEIVNKVGSIIFDLDDSNSKMEVVVIESSSEEETVC